MDSKVTNRFAQIGLTAKGIVYVLIGIMAFMAAFELGGQKAGDATRSGAFELMQNNGGAVLLAIIAAGLICYVLWRITMAFSKKEKPLKRARYALSAFAYGSVALSAIQMILKQKRDNGDSNQQLAADLLSKPMGEWLLVGAALIFAGIGIYQLYYALSEKYQDHVRGMNLQHDIATLLLRMGKVGYIARGLVWLLLSYLLYRAAISHNSSEAGDTGKVFQFIENDFGSAILGAIGVGLIGYGVFSFVRTRYEKF